MPRRFLLPPLILFTVAVLVMSACGNASGDGSDPTLAPTTTAEATTTEVPSDEEASTVKIGRSTGTILSAGLDREYVLHIPTGYDEADPLPLLVVFHGYTMTADGQATESGLPALGDDEGFITVFPEGRGDIQRWLFELDAVEIDITTANPDIAFVSDLVDMLSEEHSVDSDRIYAVGFSNGGWIASAVACTLSDRFAAAAPVAGIMDFGADCSPADPVPLITFHGTSDQYEPFNGGTENAPLRGALPTDLSGTYDELPVSENSILEASVPNKVLLWADVNGCEGDPISSVTTGETTRWTRWEYTCPEADPVVFYEIGAGTHWWDITGGFNTNEKLWEFLSSQAR
ncbi:MAG: PHB depolymerase family esterase [Actinomycetota bacterium]|nr:PHB depolymerase family esterase [Actinomycetota bacterium]